MARQILSDAAYLVGAVARSAPAASAAAASGASFIYLQAPPGPDGALAPEALREASAQQRSGLHIPLLADAAAIKPDAVPEWLQAGLDGICGTLVDLGAAFGTDADRSVPAARAALSASDGAEAAAPAAQPQRDGGDEAAPHASSHAGLLSTLLQSEGARDAVLARERALMRRVLACLAAAAPDMAEARLLEDAVAALAEPFLVVVVGEFNSGKSSVINALLGERALEEGILPTTNEISVLRHAPDGAATIERTEDGLFVRRLPAELLRKVSVVDTPGTNVIVDRQQRLTEEFVPRSDLVLFTLSADRPFTESEVRFLRYIKQWGKKVVFVVNKADLLPSAAAAAEVADFVASNAASLLGVDAATVLPVSARLALEAKLDAGSAARGGVLGSVDVEEALEPDSRWQASNFGALERFMLAFLTGGSGGEGAGAGESVRLKLSTPAFVADALLDAAAGKLAAELDACNKEVAAMEAVGGQLDRFGDAMARDSEAQRVRVRAVLDGEAAAAADAVAATLQLSNLAQLSSYVFGGDASRLPISDALRAGRQGSTAAEELAEAVQEHATWLEVNTSKQLQAYVDFARLREPGSGTDGAAASDTPPAALDVFGGSKPQSLEAIGDVDDTALAADVEQRVRSVVLETASSAAGAAGLAVVLTAVLPTTTEDLLALALAGAVSYIAFLAWPVRRADIKAAISERYGAVAEDIDAQLREELEAGLRKLRAAVQDLVAPLLEAARAEREVVEGHQAQVEELREEVDALRGDIARL